MDGVFVFICIGSQLGEVTVFNMTQLLRQSEKFPPNIYWSTSGQLKETDGRWMYTGSITCSLPGFTGLTMNPLIEGNIYISDISNLSITVLPHSVAAICPELICGEEWQYNGGIDQTKTNSGNGNKRILITCFFIPANGMVKHITKMVYQPFIAAMIRAEDGHAVTC